VKGQGKLNTHIIFVSVLMLLPKIIKIILCLSKLQLVKDFQTLWDASVGERKGYGL